MRKPVAAVILFIAPLVLLGLAGVSQAQLVLYDDFNVKPINPAKWSGNEGSLGNAAPNTEATRKIANGKLEIDLTSYGRTDSDISTPGPSRFNLNVTNPAAVTTMQADVTVKSAKVVGCAPNPTSTAATARVRGRFFNDGTSPGPGDQTGDIFAEFYKVRDSIRGDRIEALIWRCTNFACSQVSTLAFDVFTATWTNGVADTLRMQWDAANDRFIFDLNPAGPNPETKTLSYVVSDATPPVVNLRLLSAWNFVANCMSGPRASATMKALFDNVMVNP